MKKIFIIFLFIIFSSSFSLAKNNEKITVEEIEDIFFGEIKKKKIMKPGKVFLIEEEKKGQEDYEKALKEKKE